MILEVLGRLYDGPPKGTNAKGQCYDLRALPAYRCCWYHLRARAKASFAASPTLGSLSSPRSVQPCACIPRNTFHMLPSHITVRGASSLSHPWLGGCQLDMPCICLQRSWCAFGVHCPALPRESFRAFRHFVQAGLLTLPISVTTLSHAEHNALKSSAETGIKVIAVCPARLSIA